MTCDKITFNTLKEAKDRATGMSNAKGAHMKPYKCLECGKFHLATNPKYKKNNSIKKPHTPTFKFKEPPEPFMKKSEANLKRKRWSHKSTYTIGEMINLKYKQ